MSDIDNSKVGATQSTTQPELASSMALFEGERIMRGVGVPALTWFGKGNPDKPLIVFLPGSAHNARIAYGGHASYVAQDFLAHWLIAQGYNFLGVSYPIATNNAVEQVSHPGFTIRSWGRQAAEIATEIIKENKLNGKIILIVWSNGGRSPQAFTEAAIELGLEVDFCVSFSATPPNAAITILPPDNLPAQIQMLRTPDGYINLAHKYDDWYAQIQSNIMPSQVRDIIPKDIYYNDYVGHMPVNLLGQGIAHHDDGFIPSGLTFIEDSKGYDLASFPLMTTILTDNIIDSRHALTDQALWSPFLIGHIYAQYFEKQNLTPESIGVKKWRATVKLLRAAPQQLSTETTGNHLFFVGEVGAKEAASNIAQLEQRVHSFRGKLAKLMRLDK